MPQKHTPAYPAEFRERLVELVRSGRSPEELSKEFEPSAQTIRNWVAQADRDAGKRSDGLTTAEREELRRLRRENKKLKHASLVRARRFLGRAPAARADLNHVAEVLTVRNHTTSEGGGIGRRAGFRFQCP